MKARLLIYRLTAIPKWVFSIVLVLSMASCDGQGSEQTGDTTPAQDNRNVGLACVHENDEPEQTKFIKINIPRDHAEQFDFTLERWRLRRFSWQLPFISIDQDEAVFADMDMNLFRTGFAIDRETLRGSDLSNYSSVVAGEWGCSLKSWDEIDQMAKDELDRLNEIRAF